MIQILRSLSQKVEPYASGSGPLPDDVLWLDLADPTMHELQDVEACIGAALPMHDAMREIEASRRVQEVDGTLRLTATLMLFSETLEPQTTEVTFILIGRRLITLRYSNPRPFRNIAFQLDRAKPSFTCGSMVIAWLLQLITSRLADILEIIATDLDAILRSIATAADESRVHPDLTQMMGRISRNGDKCSKVHESIYTLTRILAALQESDAIPEDRRRDMRAQCSLMTRDLRSLAEYTEFQENRVGFVLDAVLGLISIEQNNVGKIFSVVATIFLPPTLIGSIYGMNFKNMPSLDWTFGYPMALLFMVLSAAVPLWYFRKKRWM